MVNKYDVFRKGDRVTVEGRIYGAKVVAVSGETVRVKYKDPNSGTVIRYVSADDVRKE